MHCGKTHGYLFTWLVLKARQVSHKGLCQGWRRLSWRVKELKGPISQNKTERTELEAESSGENLRNEIQLKGTQSQNYRQKNRITRSGQARLGYKNVNHNIPTTWRWARGDRRIYGEIPSTVGFHVRWATTVFRLKWQMSLCVLHLRLLSCELLVKQLTRMGPTWFTEYWK